VTGAADENHLGGRPQRTPDQGGTSVLVLLTGGAGFIGRHVHAELTRAGHETRVFDSFRADVHRSPRPDATAIVGDVRDPSAVDAALDGVDSVIHLAAKVGLGVDVQDLPDYADTNVTGTATLLAAMAGRGVSRLVLASSMVVYGEGLGRCAQHGPVAPGQRLETQLRQGSFESPCPVCRQPLSPMAVPETARLDPRNAYAVSKLAQEQLAASWARSTGATVTSLRYHNVFGPGLPRDTPYAGVAAIFLSALRRNLAPRVFEDGGQRRDFVHVRDVAAATVAALDVAGPDGQALNIGSGTARTVGELAAALAHVTGGPAPVISGDYRLGDVRHITADCRLARTVLDWQPGESFLAGIAELAHD
jgi:dTDP-L-rhamnose 4-epimerase